MERRTFLKTAAGVLGTLTLPAWLLEQERARARGLDVSEAGSQEIEKLVKPEEAWRRILSEEEFEILREEGTEPPHSSPLNEEERAGTFICAGCFLPLFSSETKFESGTGWPSFYAPIDPANVETKRDFKLVVPRTEYHCARCGGHQGHIFDDGPEPTGKRYCNNGLALNFVAEGEELPELRS